MVKHVKYEIKAVLIHFILSMLRWIFFPIFPIFFSFHATFGVKQLEKTIVLSSSPSTPPFTAALNIRTH